MKRHGALWCVVIAAAMTTAPARGQAGPPLTPPPPATTAAPLATTVAPPPPVPAHGQPPVPPAAPAAAEALRRLGNTGVRVHDPSTIVPCDGAFWVFSTGLGTPSFRSTDLRHWRPAGPVNTVDHPWVRDVVPGPPVTNFWAPDIIRVGDRYLLFFSASAFGKNTSGIGVMANPTLDPDAAGYRWTDGGLVVSSGPADDFNAIDPAPFLDADGKMWLAFGSFWSGIQLVELDPATGHRLAPDAPPRTLAHWDSIEAAYIYRHGGRYYLFASYGLCCRGARSSYHTRVGRAD